jgi:hypothetical protein
VEKDGNPFRLFSSIIGHCRNGKTLDEWAFEVEWSDGGTTWIELKTMK